MIRFLTGLFAIAAGLGGGVDARADVMEIGGDGFTWVAGGPPPSPMDPAQPDLSAPALDGQAMTVPRGDLVPAQWRPTIDRLAAKYDLSPALIEALVWQESRWRPNALSPAGAFGLAQLMPGTARQLGVDQRDPESNLEGGARYLRLQLNLFNGDVEKALAAYNAGPGRVLRAGGVPAITETRNYVASVMQRLSSQTRR